jgi:hypothetical protein
MQLGHETNDKNKWNREKEELELSFKRLLFTFPRSSPYRVKLEACQKCRLAYGGGWVGTFSFNFN